MIKKLQKKYALSEQGCQRSDKGMRRVRFAESVIHVSRRTLILFCKRHAGRRRSQRKRNRIHCRMYYLYRLHTSDHLVSV